jgi:hypothetical protein
LADRVKIDADQLTEARLSGDGTRVLLVLLDDSGQKVSLSLPVDCLNTVLSAARRQVEPEAVHKLDSWNMGVAENG